MSRQDNRRTAHRHLEDQNVYSATPWTTGAFCRVASVGPDHTSVRRAVAKVLSEVN